MNLCATHCTCGIFSRTFQVIQAADGANAATRSIQLGFYSCLDCGYICGYTSEWNLAGTKQSAKGCWPNGESISFALAFSLFDGRPLLTVPTPRGDEERFLSIGPLEGKFFAVV